MSIVGRPFLPDGSRLIIVPGALSDYARFEPHHYLDGHTSGTRRYMALVDNQPAAWVSVIRQVGSKGWRIHRLVVLPGFEGRGVAKTLIGWMAGQVAPLSLRTRNHGFVDALIAGGDWRASRHRRDGVTADDRVGTIDSRQQQLAVTPRTAVYDPPRWHRCQHCDAGFEARRGAKYCSGRCRVAAHREARAS